MSGTPTPKCEDANLRIGPILRYRGTSDRTETPIPRHPGSGRNSDAAAPRLGPRLRLRCIVFFSFVVVSEGYLMAETLTELMFEHGVMMVNSAGGVEYFILTPYAEEYEDADSDEDVDEFEERF